MDFIRQRTDNDQREKPALYKFYDFTMGEFNIFFSVADPGLNLKTFTFKGNKCCIIRVLTYTQQLFPGSAIRSKTTYFPDSDIHSETSRE
jgi:hypothetical protein